MKSVIEHAEEFLAANSVLREKFLAKEGVAWAEPVIKLSGNETVQIIADIRKANIRIAEALDI